MGSPTIRIITSFGTTIYVEQPTILDSVLGPLAQGWWRTEQQLLPEDHGPHRLLTCQEWEIL